MIGSLGVPEMLVLFVLALIVFGPRRLPELARSIGKAMATFRNASNEFRDTLEREVGKEERRAREGQTGDQPAPPTGLDAPPPVARASTLELPQESAAPGDPERSI